MLTTTGQPTASAERRFFAVMALAAATIVFAGFRGELLRLADRSRHPLLDRPADSTDAAADSALSRSALHRLGLSVRRAGRARYIWERQDTPSPWPVGAVLLPLMVLAGLSAAVQGARDGFNPRGPYRDALSFLFVGVTDIAVFTVLTATGLALRRRPDVHRRLMLLGTTGGLLWPAITRIPGIAGRPALMFGLLAAVVLAPAVRDVAVRARLRWLTLFVGLGVLATFPLRVAVANGAAWRSVAAWIIQ